MVGILIKKWIDPKVSKKKKKKSQNKGGVFSE